MILALTSCTVPISTRALGGLLAALIKKEFIERYREDLLYMLVSAKYDNVMTPAEIREKLSGKRKPEPTAQEIKDRILHMLVGDGTQ